MDENIFYSYQKVMSYNALLNIIIGERGVGKTYGAKKFVLNRFKKTHKQFAYVRRYETDLGESIGTTDDNKFIEQVRDLFPNDEFKITKNKKVRKIYMNGEVCGYAMPLSSASSLKSATYENVDIIIYDEFMLKEGTGQHYLKNEPEIILDLIETIGRLRDVRVICIGNAISSTNPLFTYFDLSLPYNSDIKLFKEGTILVNYIKNEKYREVKKATRFGKLIAGTKYGEYAIDNKMLMDSKSFIGKKDKNAKFYFIFTIGTRKFGVWRDYKNNLMYISNDTDPNCPMVFSLVPDDHNESTILIKYRANPYLKSVIEHYRLASLFFENQAIKNIVMSSISRFITF